MRRLSAAGIPVLLALAAVVALGAGLRAHRAANPPVQVQSADERSYAKLAVGLSRRGTWGDRATGLRRPLHWPPGAPVMFATAQQLFPDAEAEQRLELPAAYWAQALVGTGMVLAVFALGALLAGSAAGLVAAAVMAVYPPLVRSTGELLSEPLGAAALTVAAAALVWGLRRGPPWRLLPAGVLFGLAVLVRADLLFAPFLCAALLGVVLWRREGLRAGLLGAGALAAGALVAIAPWSVYASSRAGELVPVTQGDASALFVGTYLPGDGTTQGLKRELGAEAQRRNPKLRGRSVQAIEATAVLGVVAARHPELDREQAIRKEALRNLDRYALGDPLAFAGMMASKLRRMWLRSSRAGSPVANQGTRAFHTVIVLLSLLGLVAGLVLGGRERLGLAMLAVILGYSTVLHAVVVAKPRYNLPLMPLLVAGGVAGAALAGAQLRARRATRPAPGG